MNTNQTEFKKTGARGNQTEKSNQTSKALIVEGVEPEGTLHWP